MGAENALPTSTTLTYGATAGFGASIVELNGRKLLRRQLRSHLAVNAKPGALHEYLARLPGHRLIITTNYDTLLEQALRAANKPFHLVVHPMERDDWRVESWTVQGSKDEFANDFRNWHSDIHDTIRAGDTPYKWALFARPPMPAWTKGRVTLLGDACHSMLPMMAQGAVMALEDGYVLARCIRKYGVDPEALQRYETVRRERALGSTRVAAPKAPAKKAPVKKAAAKKAAAKKATKASGR